MSILLRLIILGVSVHGLCGMQADVEPKSTAQFDLFYSREDGIVSKIEEAINEAEKGSTIIMVQIFLSNIAIYQALKNFLKEEKGAVKLLIDPRHGKTRGMVEELKKNGAKLQYAKGMHVKQCIVKPKSLFSGAEAPALNDPDKSCIPEEADAVVRSSDGKGKAFFMSENLSMLADRHLEYALYTEDEQVVCDVLALHKEHETFTALDSPERKSAIRTVPKITPQKPGAVLSTAASDIEECTRQRMLKPLEDDMTELLRVATMTFDSDKIAQALIKKAKHKNGSVQLIVDASVIRAEAGRALLQRMHKAGVRIFVYNSDRSEKVWPTSNIPMLQHAKILYRLREAPDQDPDVLTVFYTGNLTKKSNVELNMASFHAGDHVLAAKAVSLLDQLVTASTPYESLNLEAIAQLEQDRKERARKKRVAKQSAKKASAASHKRESHARVKEGKKRSRKKRARADSGQ